MPVAKRVSLALICTALLLWSAALCGPSYALAYVDAIRIGGDRAFPPFEYVTDTGAYQGFNVDLMNAIGIELGIQIELVPMHWADALEALNSGDIAAIQGMTRTPAREPLYLFSDGYITYSNAIFVPVGEYGITGLEDLAGRTVAVQQRDAAHEVAAQIEGATILLAPDHPSALDMVITGVADAFIGNRLSGINTVQRRALTDAVKIVGGEIGPLPYGMAFRKDRTDLVVLFNRGLQRVRESGAYDKIYGKWFGASIDESKGGLTEAQQRALWIAASVVVGTALVVVAWNISLRRSVARSTAEITRVLALNEQILASSDEGIAAVDERMTFIWANRRAARLLGVGDGQLVGMAVSDTVLSPVVYTTNLRDVAAQGASGFVHDVEVQPALDAAAPGAGPRLLRVRAVPLLPREREQGTATPRRHGALLMFSDVTAAVRSEQLEAVSNVMEALAISVSGIASEIRKPLLSIRAYLKELPDRLDDPNFIREVQRFIPSQIDSVDSFIEDLVVFSEPPAPRPAVFGLDDAVRSAIEKVEPEVTARGVMITRDVAATPAYADSAQVSDAVYRVLSDAVTSSRYMGIVSVKVGLIDDGWAEVEVCGGNLERPAMRTTGAIAPIFRSRGERSGLGTVVSYKLIQVNGGLLTVATSGSVPCVRIRVPSSQQG